jgi:catechol 2,3-dioxygenase-like lactoylglutathione lyase family enzyme
MEVSEDDSVGEVSERDHSVRRGSAAFEGVLRTGLRRRRVDEGHATVIFQFDNLFLRLLRRGEAESEMLRQVSVGDPRAGTTVQLGFAVDDADAFCTELSERGVSIVYGPVDRPWGRRNAAFVDLDGHVWQFGSDIPDN